jgi:hypothetical protein
MNKTVGWQLFLLTIMVLLACRVVHDTTSLYFGPVSSTLATVLNVSSSVTDILMQVTLTLILTGTSLVVVLSKRYGPKDKNWAYGTLGTILGFWLHFSK